MRSPRVWCSAHLIPKNEHKHLRPHAEPKLARGPSFPIITGLALSECGAGLCCIWLCTVARSPCYLCPAKQMFGFAIPLRWVYRKLEFFFSIPMVSFFVRVCLGMFMLLGQLWVRKVFFNSVWTSLNAWNCFKGVVEVVVCIALKFDIRHEQNNRTILRF